MDSLTAKDCVLLSSGDAMHQTLQWLSVSAWFLFNTLYGLQLSHLKDSTSPLAMLVMLQSAEMDTRRRKIVVLRELSFPHPLNEIASSRGYSSCASLFLEHCCLSQTVRLGM